MPGKKQVSAGGGVVYRLQRSGAEPEILLIYRNNVWDLPKGKHEPGESIEMCAAREVSEEVGRNLPAILSELGTTYHEYVEGGTEIGKTTYWYSMIFTKNQSFKPQREEGILDVKWAHISEALEEVGYENLKKILLRFKEQKKA